MDFMVSFVIDTTPLYRIMPLKWFKVMVEEKRNTLFRPSTWEDPYETSYSNSVIVTDKGEIPLDASHWFGQCWSLCKESAIMWQAFKKLNEPYVKIKVDAFSLIADLKEQNTNLRIGILEYIRYFNPTRHDYEEKIKELMKLHPWTGNFSIHGATIADLYPMYHLLTKRDIFKHEEEVRLLLFDKSSTKDQNSVSYSLEPSVIKEVVIDPWTSKNDDKVKMIEEELRQYLPIETTDIHKSMIFSDSCKFVARYTVY